eukprot:CAMPEP_0195512854 /NCGR_PEP_ID=MMETSP0794_2-20130614/4667_1 /TAXON_ID=515487 /ORGANISM="Stephanopyxis turris, Strain CCMP 815" /LENGTH=325 /DNA_ID=CAMNT_0040640731 /DNA_START=21 /DNA_END=998 /DNA_ORIENTATION=-
MTVLHGGIIDPKALEAEEGEDHGLPSMMETEEESQLFRCAVCGVTEGDSSNLTQSQLQTNATVGCGHQFCSSCVERELSRKKIFRCPICSTHVKRVTLSTRTLDDVQCEKDTSWRRRVLQVYNKVESDFPSLLEYNNYLEEVEDIIYSIVNEEPNAEENKAKVKEYEEVHKSEIVIRQSQRADEERCVSDRIASEQREAEMKKRAFREEERIVSIAKRKLKQEATQVMLGEREEVSAELRAAQMQGYRNELRRQQKGIRDNAFSEGPRVRIPDGGYADKKPIDREMRLKRQSAGAGVPSGSIATHERAWQMTENSLFSMLALRRR